MEEEQATIDSQFIVFAKLFENKTRSGETITLWNNDYWLRQANLIDDRKITMTDTGIIFNKYGKSEIDFNEWIELITELCELKSLNFEKTIETLTNCGLPGETPVEIPQYRTFFLTYKSKSALAGASSIWYFVKTVDDIYCNATCDGYLCWPPTPAGETLYQNCPKGLLSNQKMCAFRRCSSEGLWLGRHLNDTSPKGWTNYTPCFPTLVQKILDKVNEDAAEAQLKFETAVNTRTIEMVGIVSSFLTICAAIFIFNAFPSLHNRRTVIHRHLFYALLMEVTVRMVLYTQQSYSFDSVDPLEENVQKGIEYFPYVCEGVYVLLEYSRLVVYGWMFIEGIFLNTLISANTLRNEIPINYFYTGGWGAPAIVIAIWGTVVGRHYSKEPLNTCWYGYNYLPSYYIIQGPILAIVSINMLFLGTIMSVVIMKLRRTNDSELRKIQKTIRATLILLPLLGIINIFNLFDYPLDGSSTGFAIWAYFTHFFRSFQGVFISFIYCFSNGEVRKAIQKKFERRTWFRFEWIERRRRVLPPGRPRERPIFAIADDNMELVPVPIRTWTLSPSTRTVSDVETGLCHAEVLPETKNKLKMPRGRRNRPARHLPNNDNTHANTNRTHAVRFRNDQVPAEAPNHMRDSVQALSAPIRTVRFRENRAPTESLARMRVTEQAHSSLAFPIRPAPNLRLSDTLHPNQLYAVSFRNEQAEVLAEARIQVAIRARNIRLAELARHSSTGPPWNQRRFQYSVGEMSYKFRAYLEMPFTLLQAQDLGVLRPRRSRSCETRVSDEQLSGFRMRPRSSGAIATRASNEIDEFDRQCRDFEVYRPSSSEHAARMPDPLDPPGPNPNGFNSASSGYTPQTAPRRSRSFVRPSLVTRESYLRTRISRSACF